MTRPARSILLVPALLLLSVHVISQSCVTTGNNNATFSISCGTNCGPVTLQVPHLKSSSTYSVVTTPYQPFPHNTGTELVSTYVDDKYSTAVDMPFSVCFFDAVYSQCVIGSNGVVTFDLSQANLSNAYTLTVAGQPQPIPYSGGVPNSIGTTFYPPASIFGAYHDIDPSGFSSPNRRIEWAIFGTAPCRKFVVSFFEVPMYNCTSLRCTQQIVIYEGTGLIDVFLGDKPVCASWENGLAILGIQDWSRTQGIAAPGKNCTQWSAQNEGYRFVPSGGASRFSKAELFKMDGTFVDLADTTTSMPGLLDITFPNVCPTGASEQFVVKTTYVACGTPLMIEAMDTITVNFATNLTTNITTQNVQCNGQNNGVITVTASGGVTPYQYSINGTTYQTSNTFNVVAGTYTVYIKDASGCIKTETITITQPNALTLSATSSNASCAGGPDGVITATAGGGTVAYQYSINGTSFQSSNVFNVVPGQYTVTVRDANNCTATYPITVGLTNNLAITPFPDTTICEGNSVQLTVNTNANQFAWTPATGLSATAIQNPVASPVATTQYFVTATLGNCSGKDTIVVTVLPAPVPDAGIDGDICYGQNYQLNGSGGTQFTWSPSNTLDDATISNPIATPAQTITYTLSVVDANGCASLTTDDVLVNVTPPIIVITSPVDTIVSLGDQFQIKASSVATDYSWSPPFGLSSSTIPDPVLTVTSDVLLTVTASTSAGCKGEGTVNIKVYKGPDIYVPTGFTPNNDGRNDIFKPVPVGIKEYRYFRVYNRWGQLIYSTKNFNEGWDGRIRGIEQPTGTYVWMIEGITKDDKVITKRGTVTLIR